MMNNELLNSRYKAKREIKTARDGKIYWLVTDQQEGGMEKMLKGIALVSEQQKSEANLEIDLLNCLDHPNVVKLLDSFVFKEQESEVKYHALILEYMEGGDLGSFCQKMAEKGEEGEELDWKEEDVLRLASQLLIGIEYIHERGVIHRDLKAENILLSKDEKTLKIADFNVSKVTQETVNTAVIGTMENMPPEGIKGGATGDLSFSWDFWAIGIILQLLCVFRHPFAAGNTFQTMMNIVNCMRNPAQVCFPKIENLIKHCLKIEVGERAGSASELLEYQALSSLVAQLKNGILPGNLVFGKNRMETTEIIIEKVNRENKQLTEENSDLKAEIIKLNREKEELEKKFNREKSEIKKKTDNEKKKHENEIFGMKENHKREFLMESLIQRFKQEHIFASSRLVVRDITNTTMRRFIRFFQGSLMNFRLPRNYKFREVFRDFEFEEDTHTGRWYFRQQSFPSNNGVGGKLKLTLELKGGKHDFKADAMIFVKK